MVLCSFLPYISSCNYHQSEDPELFPHHKENPSCYSCIYASHPKSPSCPITVLFSISVVLSFQEWYINTHFVESKLMCWRSLGIFTILLLEIRWLWTFTYRNLYIVVYRDKCPRVSELFRLYGKGNFSFIRKFQTVFPEWLFCFIFSSAVCERSTCSSCLPTFVIIFYLSYSSRYTVIPYCSFNLHFPNG